MVTSGSESKVLAVQSWDGVPRKNQDEAPYGELEFVPRQNREKALIH